MKRISLFRMLLYIISISLIFDFFFIVVEISDSEIVSGLTLFDRAFIDKRPIEEYVLHIHEDSNFSMIIYLLLLVSPILILFFLFLTRNNVKFKLKQSNLIFPIAIFGLLAYSVFVSLFARYLTDTPALFSVTKGYFGWLVGIIKYALLIYLSFQIRFRQERNLDDVKVHASTIFFISIITELILMFFFTPIDNRISYEVYNPMYKKHDYTKFMYSPFFMMFKYKNFGVYEGKSEFYPYMIIVLLCYIGSLALAFFNNKRNHIITISLLSISIIVLIIGSIDLTDSFMAHYMTNKKPNFINCIGFNFYLFIILTGALIFLRVMQILDINLINRTKELVNVDEYVKEHENKGGINNEENIVYNNDVSNSNIN